MDAHAYGLYQTAIDLYQILNLFVEPQTNEITDQAWSFPLNGKGFGGELPSSTKRTLSSPFSPFSNRISLSSGSEAIAGQATPQIKANTQTVIHALYAMPYAPCVSHPTFDVHLCPALP